MPQIPQGGRRVQSIFKCQTLYRSDSGNRSEAEIECPEGSPARGGAKRHQRLIHLPRPPPPPFDIEQRRGSGGVLDVGGARRVRPPGGAGESNHGTHQATLAGHQGMDPGRRPGPKLVQPGKGPHRRGDRELRPKCHLAAQRDPTRRRPHSDPRRQLKGRNLVP
jgi:hypothetical protein